MRTPLILLLLLLLPLILTSLFYPTYEDREWENFQVDEEDLQVNDSYLESFFNLFKTENKNYFICDHIDGDRTSTLIIDTKRKKLTWGENDDFVNYRESEVSITVEDFSGGLINDDLKRFKTIFRFNKLKGTFESVYYSRETPTQNYGYDWENIYNCRKTEPLLD